MGAPAAIRSAIATAVGRGVTVARSTIATAVAVGATVAVTGCGQSGAVALTGPVTLRLGYLPNLTHATAIAGIETGTFARHLGENRLEVTPFNAGPEATEALLSGAVDAAYIGPSPAVTAFTRSNGAIRIVSGATSGGAALVVRPEVARVEDLRGRTLATPQLGNTQDVALRHWLKVNGLRTDVYGGGDVSILPQDGSRALDAFKQGHIDGAWVPEPWVGRLVEEGPGKVLVDEADLWPGGRFVATLLVVSTSFLERRPDVVRALLEAQVEANDLVNADPAEAQRLVARGIRSVTGKDLPPTVVARAWPNLEFTNDPVAESLRAGAEHASGLGLLKSTDLDGIHDLRLLNQVLAADGRAEIAP